MGKTATNSGAQIGEDLGGYILESLNKCDDSIIILDKKGRYVFLNNTGWKVLARNEEEVIGTNVWKLLPHLKGTEFEKAAKLAMKSQSTQNIKEFYPHRNETYQVKFFPSREFLLVQITNVTDIVRAKEISDQLMDDLQYAMEVYWSEENKDRREKQKSNNGANDGT